MVVAPCQIAGKGSQVADASLGMTHNEYTEHLALLEFFVPVGAGLQIGLYLFGGLDAKCMGRVVEGVGELLRQGDVADGGMEGMDVCSNI